MFGSLDVSTSALIAQRTRMNIIASNIAKADAIEDEAGNYAPYRRRAPIFAVGDPAMGNRDGVHVSEIEIDQSELRKKWEPTHKFADEQGYVYYPNVDSTTEMINALEASRAYEANITAAEMTKSMLQSSLRLLA